MPYPYAHDADGFQFVGYHVTHSSDWTFDPTKTSDFRLPEDVGVSLFTSFEPEHWAKYNGGQHAAEVWVRKDHDLRQDAPYKTLQINVYAEQMDVKITKVIPLAEAVRNTKKLLRKNDSYTPEMMDEALGIYWDKSGNKETFVGSISPLIELACHDASCAPPPIGTGGSTPGPHGTVSTRVPKAVKAEKPVTGLGTNLHEIPTAVALKQAQAIISKVPGFKHLADHPGFAEGADESSQKKAVDTVVDQIADNVIEVFDRSPNPDVTRQWYDVAHKMSEDLGAKYGLHPNTVAGVIASLSPQQPWDDNVAHAKVVLEAMQRKNLTDHDVREVNRIAVQQYNNKVATWTDRIAKAEAEGRTSAADKIRANPPKPPEQLDPKTVNRLDQLTNEQASFFVRNVAGSVRVPKVVLTEDGGYSFDTSSTTGLRWNSYPMIEDAVSIIRDPTTENVSKALGGAHKVRSFYNNIADPNSPQGDVTMDTHAFGIGFRIPVTQSHPLIATGKGNIYGTPSNAAAGTHGVHVLMAEGYRRATKRINRRSSTRKPYQPREVQSVTWEQWRYDYPGANRAGKGRNKGTMARAEEVLRAADAEGWSSRRVARELQLIRDTVKLADQ